MTCIHEDYLKFISLVTTERRRPDFTMRWRNGEWSLKADFIDVPPKDATAPVLPPYKFVAKTRTRFDRMVKLLAAIEVTHPDDARMMMTTSLEKLFWKSPAVGQPSVLEDKQWRAGNVTRHPAYWFHEPRTELLWRKQGTSAEEDFRTTLLYRIFNSLSPSSKAKIVTAFMSLI